MKPAVPLKGKLRSKILFGIEVHQSIIIMEKKMFYNAGPLLFARAKELRNNVITAENDIVGLFKNKGRS